ncbi:type II secretion system F family protein [Vibrio barjaei]|uniref:type II secretion system F family protein n=1 Tax=Vibrio barjaei TaxID=1676683 RepID=UPI002283426A|nr:type II secretion system F family protein [Vibrio barjaei]MCY9872982.1 type II secretion system F family protein [Vibrio barjaei]
MLKKLTFGSKAQIELLTDMCELIGEGMSMFEVATDLVRFGRGKQVEVGQAILDSVAQGKSVSDGLAKNFPDVAIQSIRAGEASQDIRGGMQNAIQAIESTSGVTTALLLSMAWPFMQSVVITAIVVGLSSQIFPILGDLVPRASWPMISRTFSDLVNGISDNWLMIIFTIGFSVYGLGYTLKNLTGSTRDALDAMPVFRQYRYVVASQVMFTVAAVLRSGHSMMSALDYAKRDASKYQVSKIEMIKRKVVESRSSSLGSLFDVNLLHDRELNRLKVLSSMSTGNAGRLQYSAESHTKVVSRQAGIAAGVLKVLAMCLGVFLLLMMLASILMLVMQARSSM